MIIVNTTPAGTIMPTVEEFNAGTKMNNINIKIIGNIAIFQFLETNTTASAPKSAGIAWSKAGANVSDVNIG